MSSRIKTFALIVSVVAALFALPATAGASGSDVIKDCTYDGHIDGNWSQADYEEAEQQLNGDNDSYSDCREVIAQGRAGAGSNNDSGSGSSGSGSSARAAAAPVAGRSAPARAAGRVPPARALGRLRLVLRQARRPRRQPHSRHGRSQPRDRVGRLRADRGGQGRLRAGTRHVGCFRPSSRPDRFNQNAMPLPVLIALVAVGLLVVATSALVARKRLPAVGRGALRLVRR